MSGPRILLQLDPEAHCSVFDAVVAIDSEVDHLLQYAVVEPLEVRDLIHGAIFTRAADQLRNTAIFVGGNDVSQGEALLKQVTGAFFGPLRVSVMMDANGANTTASAAVVAAGRHVELAGASAVVLAATGPVGQRAVRMLVRAGTKVRVASRSLERADEVCVRVAKDLEGVDVNLAPVAVSNVSQARAAVDGVDIVIAAGASGIQLLSENVWRDASSLRVAIDLNAVPPLGIEGIDVMDKAVDRKSVSTYGAIGVGGTKMKIHKECIRRLFQRNDLVLDADEVFQIGCELEAAKK
jgi:hypothetical protein